MMQVLLPQLPRCPKTFVSSQPPPWAESEVSLNICRGEYLASECMFPSDVDFFASKTKLQSKSDPPTCCWRLQKEPDGNEDFLASVKACSTCFACSGQSPSLLPWSSGEISSKIRISRRAPDLENRPCQLSRRQVLEKMTVNCLDLHSLW